MFCGIIKVVRNEVLSMSMTRRGTNKDFGFIIGTMEEFVPEDHLVRKMEEALNWDFIYPLVKPLYSLYGRPSIDPVILFKMIFINYSFGIHSMRKTCEEIKVNLAYRWFLGISLDEPVPNYSTWSQNYIRRYGDSDVFERIFERIIQQGLYHYSVLCICCFLFWLCLMTCRILVSQSGTEPGSMALKETTKS